MTTGKDVAYIQERLESLFEVETKIVSLLDNLSSAMSNLQEGKRQVYKQGGKATNDSMHLKFKENTAQFYENLSGAAVKLRREIRLLDNKTSGASDESSSILPTNINKKATWMGKAKLDEELDELKDLLLQEGKFVSVKAEIEPEAEKTATTAEGTTEIKDEIKDEIKTEPIDEEVKVETEDVEMKE